MTTKVEIKKCCSGFGFGVVGATIWCSRCRANTLLVCKRNHFKQAGEAYRARCRAAIDTTEGYLYSE